MDHLSLSGERFRRLCSDALGALFNGPALPAYFRSGWAFLIPYLAAYLLYASLKWPVNTANHAEWAVPSLLHVYWTLHALHLVLGAIALRAWGRNFPVNRLPSAANWCIAPWLCLGAIFLIPGVYLEWPSDPWEHLRRINEWHSIDEVTNHSSWRKSSYFLPYSLTRQTTGSTQLSCLHFYYTVVCLLLSWQYYRLARAVGLGERGSFIFVLLTALISGNNVFTFCRYYGLSSSIFAQLGALALMRLALELFRPWRQKKMEFPHSHLILLRHGIGALPLCALVSFNHIQGVGIAALGVLSVLVGTLLTGRPRAQIWLVAAVVALSFATFAWVPLDHDQLDSYRQAGWFSAWYGFNLLAPGSPATTRAMEILGVWGVFNITCGLLLLRRKPMAAALTLTPIAVLCMPFFALPYWYILFEADQTIFVYHRMLFAIPTGLAAVALFAPRAPAVNHPNASADRLRNRDLPEEPTAKTEYLLHSKIGSRAFPLLLAALCAALVVPPSGPGFNRIYQALAHAPRDLTMLDVLTLVQDAKGQPAVGDGKLFIASTGVSFSVQSAGLATVMVPHRAVFVPPADKVVPTANAIRSLFADPRKAVLLLLPPTTPYTPYSQLGKMSGHWDSNAIAFEFTDYRRIANLAHHAGFEPISTDSPVLLKSDN